MVQGGLTFELVLGAFRGLLGGRAGVVLTSRDGAYEPGTPYAALDYQMPYLKFILGFMGIDPVHEVIGEPMVLGGVEAGRAALARATERAASLGRSL